MSSNANAGYLLRQSRESNMLTGRYVQRDNMFKSNRFYFDFDTCEAFSYDWWQFVIRVGNTIIFNAARYSMQTDVHQEMAENILRWEGVAVDRYGSKEFAVLFPNIKVKFVYYREGLNHLSDAITNMERDIQSIKEDIANPRSQKRKNKERLADIKRIQLRIKKTKKLKKVVDKQIKLNNEAKRAKEEVIWQAELHKNQLARMRQQRLYHKDQTLTVIQGGAS